MLVKPLSMFTDEYSNTPAVYSNSAGCQLGLQHTSLEFAYFRIDRSRLERPNQRLASVRRVQNRIHPKPSRRVAWVGLLLVGRKHRFSQLSHLARRKFLSFPFELLGLEFGQRAGGRIATHHGVASRRPCAHESR